MNVKNLTQDEIVVAMKAIVAMGRDCSFDELKAVFGDNARVQNYISTTKSFRDWVKTQPREPSTAKTYVLAFGAVLIFAILMAALGAAAFTWLLK